MTKITLKLINFLNFVLGKPSCLGSIGHDDNFSVQHFIV